MAKTLASKPASPRRKVASPEYPALIALALSLPVAACVDSPTGSPARPFADAGTSKDVPVFSIPDGNIRIDGGTPLDAELEAAPDVDSVAPNSDPGGILAYVFTPESDATSDEVP